MRHGISAALLVTVALLASGAAHAAAVSALVGAEVRDLRGETAGKVQDLIVDVRDGRVLYAIVDAGERFFTLPVRALRAAEPEPRLDMQLAGELAATDDPRLRRAARLIGQPLNHPGGERIGTIADIEFDPASGHVERVVVAQGGERSGFPPSVLAHGRFPPLTRWQVEHPPAEVSGDPGYVRREPSDARERIHDHRWPRN